MSDLDHILKRRADAISEMFRPPRWRVFSYWQWKRHDQPQHILWAMYGGIHGNYAPLRRYGIALPSEEGWSEATEILIQTRKLKT